MRDELSFAELCVYRTDPPYYDNIGYADLSDFFYVWLRRSLRELYPELLGTHADAEGRRADRRPISFWW